MRITVHIVIFLLAHSLLNAQDNVPVVSAAAEDSSVMRVVRLSVNSPQSDFSPVLLNDHLWFISARTQNLGMEYVDMKGNAESIYTLFMHYFVEFITRFPAHNETILIKYQKPFQIISVSTKRSMSRSLL